MLDPFLQKLENRRLRREAERMSINKRLAELNAEGEQDAVAKKVYLSALDEPSPKPDAVEAAPAPPPTAPAPEIPMVKDMILAIIKDAYPVGLTAAQIKGKAFLRYKQHINPNTLTVTLGRYSKPKEGEPRRARCDGRTWFYVPSNGEMVVRTIDLLGSALNGGKSTGIVSRPDPRNP